MKANYLNADSYKFCRECGIKITNFEAETGCLHCFAEYKKKQREEYGDQDE